MFHFWKCCLENSLYKGNAPFFLKQNYKRNDIINVLLLCECGNTESLDIAATSWPIVPAPDVGNTSHALILTFI
jgi:hypothetical protein